MSARLGGWLRGGFGLALIGGLVLFFSRLSALEFYPLIAKLGIFAILAMSLNLVNGLVGNLHLGIAGFMALGAYGAGLVSIYATHPEWGRANLLLGAAGGMGLALLAALVVGLPTLRLRGDYFAIVTLGFGEIIRNSLDLVYFPGGAMFADEPGGIGGPTGIGFTEFPEEVAAWKHLPGIADYSARYADWWLILLVAGGLYVLLRNLKFSGLGRALLTIREDEIAARSLGVHVPYYKLLAFLMSSALAGLAGVLYFHHDTLKVAPQEFDLLKSVSVLLMVILGGLGSFSGAILGAVILGVLPTLLRHADLTGLSWLPDGVRYFPLSRIEALLYAGLLIILIRLVPHGLLGTHELPPAWTQWWRRRAGGRSR